MTNVDAELFCDGARIDHGEPNALGTCPYCDAQLVIDEEDDEPVKKMSKIVSIPTGRDDEPNYQLGFTVGDKVHWGFNGDSYPGTVIGVERRGRTVIVREDEFTMDPSDGGLKEGNRKGTFADGDGSRTLKFMYREGRGFCQRGTTAWWLNHGHAWSRNPSF